MSEPDVKAKPIVVPVAQPIARRLVVAASKAEE